MRIPSMILGLTLALPMAANAYTFCTNEVFPLVNGQGANWYGTPVDRCEKLASTSNPVMKRFRYVLSKKEGNKCAFTSRRSAATGDRLNCESGLSGEQIAAIVKAKPHLMSNPALKTWLRDFKISLDSDAGKPSEADRELKEAGLTPGFEQAIVREAGASGAETDN